MTALLYLTEAGGHPEGLPGGARGAGRAVDAPPAAHEPDNPLALIARCGRPVVICAWTPNRDPYSNFHRGLLRGRG